uniref:Uncharacterized protein n=1 Tax=Aegilops tauschii subsp. strangulata TaxID=200361 RepID=A0A453HII6_AEGTS
RRWRLTIETLKVAVSLSLTIFKPLILTLF